MNKFLISFFLVLFALLPTKSFAQYITISPTGNSNIKIKNIKEAGDGYPNNYKTKKVKAKMSVTFNNASKNQNQKWQILISKQDTFWDDELQIWLKGKKKKGVDSGANQFKQIKNYDIDFLGGKGKVSNVQLEFEIRNISITIPAESYSTELVFTIIEE